MMETDSRAKLRVVTLVAVLVLALGAAACGSDDDGDGDQGAQASSASNDPDPSGTTQQVAQTGSPEQRIRTAYAAFVEGFYKKDPATICEGMTTAAQEKFGKQFAASNKRGDASCESQMRLLINSAESFSKNKPTIVKLKVNGDKATIGAKTKNSDTYNVPYAKEDGVWRVSGGFATQ